MKVGYLKMRVGIKLRVGIKMRVGIKKVSVLLYVWLKRNMIGI